MSDIVFPPYRKGESAVKGIMLGWRNHRIPQDEFEDTDTAEGAGPPKATLYVAIEKGTET